MHGFWNFGWLAPAELFCTAGVQVWDGKLYRVARRGFKCTDPTGQFMNLILVIHCHPRRLYLSVIITNLKTPDMKSMKLSICLVGFNLLLSLGSFGQGDSTYSWDKARKNIVRYNLSSAMVFGIDKTVILGYERLVKPNRSFSFNVGTTALPKLVNLDFDSLQFNTDSKNSGFNFSFDYRFYLNKLNRYNAPRGVYIGPYYSFNQWTRHNQVSFQNSNGTQKLAKSEMNFNLHMAGFELGYQFIFWNRLAVDMVLVGPGVGFYNIKANSQGSLTDAEREKLQNALVEIIGERFPGMNYVLSDEQFKGSGRLTTSSIGYRYLVHIGFLF